MWYFFDTGALPGKINMAFDEWLAGSFFRRTGISCFRLYAWNPPALSLGYHQDARIVDRERAAADGIDTVYRPTGGRAILHDQEITYSVVTDASNLPIVDLYRNISRVLIAALRDAGYDVDFAGTEPHYPSLYRTNRSIPCFTSSGKYEIRMGGKKLVGSAQRRYRHPDGSVTALQHGSLLTGSAHYRLIDYLLMPDEEKRTLYRELKETTISLDEAGGCPADIEHIKEKLFNAAARMLADGSWQSVDAAEMLEAFQSRADYASQEIL